jgi:hypothetical protein
LALFMLWKLGLRFFRCLINLHFFGPSIESMLQSKLANNFDNFIFWAMKFVNSHFYGLNLYLLNLYLLWYNNYIESMEFKYSPLKNPFPSKDLTNSSHTPNKTNFVLSPKNQFKKVFISPSKFMNTGNSN